MSEPIDIRDKDKLDDVKIKQIALNWKLAEEAEELSDPQKVMLYCLEEIRKLKNKVNQIIKLLNE